MRNQSLWVPGAQGFRQLDVIPALTAIMTKLAPPNVWVANPPVSAWIDMAIRPFHYGPQPFTDEARKQHTIDPELHSERGGEMATVFNTIWRKFFHPSLAHLAKYKRDDMIDLFQKTLQYVLMGIFDYSAIWRMNQFPADVKRHHTETLTLTSGDTVNGVLLTHDNMKAFIHALHTDLVLDTAVANRQAIARRYFAVHAFRFSDDKFAALPPPKAGDDLLQAHNKLKRLKRKARVHTRE